MIVFSHKCGAAFDISAGARVLTFFFVTFRCLAMSFPAMHYSVDFSAFCCTVGMNNGCRKTIQTQVFNLCLYVDVCCCLLGEIKIYMYNITLQNVEVP